MKTETPACRMQVLSQWSPDFHLFGLEFTEKKVSLSHKYFSCCDGSGIRIESFEEKTARVCPLSSRWAAVSSYFKQIQDFCADVQKINFSDSDLGDFRKKEPGQSVLAMMELILSEELEAFLNSTKGKVFDELSFEKKLKLKLATHWLGDQVKHLSSSLFWQIGATLIWHYDVLVFPYSIVNHKKSATTTASSAALLPISYWDDLIGKHPNKRRILLIQGVRELWNAANLERLDGLIAFASERKIPLWLVDSSNQSTATSEVRATELPSFRASMNERIEKLKQRPALEWLSQQSLSRLSELTLIPEAKPNPPIIPSIV